MGSAEKPESLSILTCQPPPAKRANGPWVQMKGSLPIFGLSSDGEGQLESFSKKSEKSLDFFSSVPKDSSVLEVWNGRTDVAKECGID